MSIHNPLYLSHQIRGLFLPQLQYLRDAILKRTLPTFDSISKEAGEASDRAYNDFCEPAGPESDEATAAEMAHKAGIYHYSMLSEMKQGLVNLFAVAIHHTFEQQEIALLRDALLMLEERRDRRLFNHGEFVRRLQAGGIDPIACSAWGTLEELRHVANGVKHADGRALDAVRKIRSDLFMHPALERDSLSNFLPLSSEDVSRREVLQPLAGHDIYVREADLEKYLKAAEEFWRWLMDQLEAVAARSPQQIV